MTKGKPSNTKRQALILPFLKESKIWKPKFLGFAKVHNCHMSTANRKWVS